MENQTRYRVTRKFLAGGRFDFEEGATYTSITTVEMPVGMTGGGPGFGSPYVVIECEPVTDSDGSDE